jgi:hypothetical protein
VIHRGSRRLAVDCQEKWLSICVLLSEDVVVVGFLKENTMKSMAFTVHSMQKMTENRAKRRQISGQSLVRFGPQDQKAPWRRLITPGLCLISVFFLVFSGALGAQTQPGQWSNLNRLKAGQGIELIESTMKHHAGEFVTVTDELLTLKESGADLSIKREHIARVSTSSAPKRGEHAVIGLVVGGAVGAAIGAASGSNHGFFGGSSRGIAALVGIAIGAPSGALVGAVIPAHTTVYRAAPGTSR